MSKEQRDASTRLEKEKRDASLLLIPFALVNFSANIIRKRREMRLFVSFGHVREWFVVHTETDALRCKRECERGGEGE